jgi:short-subunit dehydrogenase
MIVLGSNSDISQAFIEKVLTEGQKFETIYLLSSNEDSALKLSNHINVKFNQKCEVVVFDLLTNTDYSKLSHIKSDLLFCATGYLGKGSDEFLYDEKNTQKIIEINYSKLIPLLNFFAQKFEENKKGTIIALSSVAGERGRQSNFIYGSAKAGFTAYLSGLRNYMFHKGVHVITIIPGFMDTKMTFGLNTPKPITASPQKAASVIYSAYKKKKDVVYVTAIWWFIMTIIKNIPEFIFKKLKM